MKNFTQTLLLAVFCLLATVTKAVPKLNSLPTATATIFLDFDGQSVIGSYWNNGNPIFCAAPSLTTAQITEIFNRVSEDYRPFNVNITTDSTKFLSAPLTQRIRVIITPTSSWKAGVGGISYTGSFTWGDDTPAFVFSDRLGPNNAKYIAECCSHESGHTVGLSHQSKYDANCALLESYSTGYGSGETSWAPIMGNSYGKNMSGWNNGPTPYGCAVTQDNLSIITSTNGFTYRTDDYSDSLSNDAFTQSNSSFSINGIITKTTDKDVFRFQFTQNTTIHIDALPFSVGSGDNGSNLDIKLLLYNEAKTLLRTYDPTNMMSVSLDTTLKAGSYYFMLDGTGNANTSEYGSLGSYTFTGFRSALPIQSVTLTGNVVKNKHELNWNVMADEPIRSVEVEYSTNGNVFNVLNNLALTSRTMSYIPNDAGTRFYRVKATSINDQVVYSNIIALKGAENQVKSFNVSTFVKNQISITAAENYQYKLMDMNGRILATGKGAVGMNTIDMTNKIAGIYVIQLLGNTASQTERIIKQ